MSLQMHSPCFPNKAYHIPNTLFLFSPTKPKFAVKSRSPSDSSKPTPSIDDAASLASPPREASSPGLGFGSPPSSNSSSAPSKRKKGSKRERASIIRRSPLEKPAFISNKDEVKVKERSQNESAFLLAWLGFGAVILAEGISLAASGFLPEEWDKIFVKYLYPSFTPTVFLFVAGTVLYGVYKYLQNERVTGQK